MNPAASAKVPRYPHPARLARTNQIIEHLIDDRFVENPLVAEVEVVILQALKLNTNVAGNVFQFDCREIRQARLRANAGELWIHMLDRIIAVRIRIRKRLKLNHGEVIVYCLKSID